MTGPGSRPCLPVAAFFALSLVLAAPAVAATSSPPAILNVTPSQVTQGDRTTVAVQVNYLPAGASIRFDPGFTVVGRPDFSNPALPKFGVSVGCDVPAGRHEVRIAASDGKLLPTRGYLTVQTAVPDVLLVVPGEAAQGRSASLTLAGPKAACLQNPDFGRGVGVRGGPFPKEDVVVPGALTVQQRHPAVGYDVAVAPDAPPGPHDITIRYDAGRQRRIATAKLVVRASQAPAPEVGAVGPPDVVAVSPAVLQRGREATLDLTLKNFTADLQLSFGAGVAVKGRPVFRGNDREHAALKVAVAADAPLGLHEISIQGAARRRTASASLTVAPGAAGPPPVALEQAPPPPAPLEEPVRAPLAPARPAIFAVSPNVLRAGASYELTLTGRNLPAGLQVRFGDGVVVRGEPRVISPSLARLTVAVAAAADPGERRVEAAAAKGREFSRTAATARIAGAPRAAGRPKADVVPLYEATPYVPKLAKITLIEPSPWNEEYASGAVFNDQTTFRWQEENPGISEEFELRIVYLARDGKQSPLVSARIKPHQGASLPPTHYSPDASLWDELITGSFDIEETSTADFPGAPEYTSYSGKLGTRVMHWQVFGYRVFTSVSLGQQPGATPGGPVNKKVTKTEVLVAESELRPLRHPTQPLGLWCSSAPNSLTPEGSRDSHDVKFDDLEDSAPGVFYTNDRIEVSGTIRLADLPYEVKADAAPEPDGGESTNYYNIFVDWGDGSGAIPLGSEYAGAPDAANKGYQKLGKDAALIPAVHRYSVPGTRVIRVFMLSAADAWFNDPSALAPAVDEAQPESPAPWYEDPEQFGGGSAMEVARRAYLLYCGSITVVPRKDPVAEGPLQLESLTITGFNGEGGPDVHQLGVVKDAKIAPGGPLPKSPAAEGAAARADFAAPGLPARQRADAPAAAGTPTLKMADQAGPSAVSVQGTPLAPQIPPAFSACDSLQGNARLTYFGCGTARVEWRLEDLSTGASTVIATEEVPVGPSPARENLGPPPKEGRAELEVLEAPGQGTGAPAEPAPILGVKHLSSKVVALTKEQAGGQYALRASAAVIGHCKDAAAAAAAAGLRPWTVGRPERAELPARQRISRNEPDAPGQLGVLSPYREGGSKRTGVGYVRATSAADRGATLKPLPAKPFYVASDPSKFMVVESDPKLPCRFLFTTADGGFPVDTLRELQDLGGGRWSGRGAFHFLFADAPGSGKQEKLVQATFSSWLAPDGMQVTEGALDLQSPLPGEIDAHGMRVRIGSLTGAAGAAGQVDLQLSARLPPGRLPGADVSWSAAAPLTAAGDWIAEAGPVPRVPLAYSGHDLESKAAVIDLSEAANLREPSPGCGPAGPGWMGFHFGDARIFPNTFGLFAGLVYDAPGWTAAAKGLCGKGAYAFSGGPAAFKEGVLGWKSIATAADGSGNFTSTYQNFTATVPEPIGASFTGAVVLHDQQGKEPFADFSSVKGPGKIERSYATPGGGRIDLKAARFGLGKFSDVGWGIKTDLELTFRAEGKVFAAKIPVGGLVEGFDGHLYRSAGDQSPVLVPLGVGTTLGKNVAATIEQAKVSGFGSGSIEFGFSVKVRISDQLAETPMPVGYRLLQQQGASYAGRGPIASPFVQEIVYNGGGDGGVATKVELSFMQGDSAGGGANDVSVGQCASTDFFCGSTEGMEFLGAAVKADFRLGYKQGADYFALRAEVSGLNVTLPPCFALYAVRGGLGHNFKLTDFLQKSLLEVVPDMGGDFVFMAGMQAGLAADPSILSFDATLLISTGEQPMLTYKAWILSPTKSEQGDVWGFFTVGASGFDGAIAGEKSIAGDVLKVTMPGDIGCYGRPSVKEVVACAQGSWASVMHFGGLTDWYVYIGRKDGPRVKATLVSLFEPDAYVMLQGVGGLAFGASFELSKELSSGKFKAGFSIGSNFGGKIMWPDPIGVSADAAGWAKVYACYKSLCVDPGVNLWLTMELSTAKKVLAGGFSVGLICPVDDVTFGLRILPSPGLSADVDWCDFGLF